MDMAKVCWHANVSTIAKLSTASSYSPLVGSLLDVPTHTVNMTTLKSTHDLWKSYSMSPYEVRVIHVIVVAGI